MDKKSGDERVLISFKHGLGDAVQFTVILRHLQALRPDWIVSLHAPYGKHSVGLGHCEQVFDDRGEPPNPRNFDSHYRLDWHECHRAYSEAPSTKTTKCLDEIFGLPPQLDLYKYMIQFGDEDLTAADEYLERISATSRAVLLHYEGNTSKSGKNLTHADARSWSIAVRDAGFVPVILDWDARSPLPFEGLAACPDKHDTLWRGATTGDARILAALISRAVLMVGIDSGPLHVAGATTTPTLALWTGHHPAQFFDLCDNVAHLVPENWRTIGLGQDPAVQNFFERHYDYSTYRGIKEGMILMTLDKLGKVTSKSGNLKMVNDFCVRVDNVEQDMVIINDVYHNDAYRTKLLSDNAGPQVVVDIGAHIGTFARLWHGKNPEATIACVEACPENHEALEANVGEFAKILRGACTYEPGELMLLNAVRPNCESTGGSVVVPVPEQESSGNRQAGYKYWPDVRPLRKFTLEEIMNELGVDHIDVLKLDCEGSEFSILGETPSLNRIRIIVGEYHDIKRWKKLLKDKFSSWDYGEMSTSATGMGNFHLANPKWPPLGTKPWQPSDLIREHVLPGDDVVFEANTPWYSTIYKVARTVMPKLVVEIGVRAGYGGRMIQIAVPGCSVIGIDADVDKVSRGYWRKAPYPVLEVNSWEVAALQRCDLVLIDGDHSAEGVRHDLIIATAASDNVLVDDAIDDGADGTGILEAVNDFAGKPGWQLEIMNDRVAHLHRVRKTLKIAIPAGIGDSLWVLTKIQALMRQESADKVALTVCDNDPHQRSRGFLSRFPFVESVNYESLDIVDSPRVLPGGVINYAPPQRNWHGRFDWLLQANYHLERGKRLEDWMPELETNWQIFDAFQYDPVLSDDGLKAKSFIAFYFGPEKGNTTDGHNRGSIWTPHDWLWLGQELQTKYNLPIVAIGAEWDRSYFEKFIKPTGLECQDLIGKTTAPQVINLLSQASLVVGYQSGLVISSAFLGTPTVGFWRAAGDSVSPSLDVWFDDEMRNAWVPPGAKWFGATYDKHTSYQVLREIVDREWLD